MTISALALDDPRTAEIKVAGPAALLVAKLHKLGERQDQPDRLIDKDAHDIYRLLVATDTGSFSQTLIGLQNDELAADATHQAITYLQELFAPGPEALGSMMAGRAEQLVGDPAVVSASVTALAQDLLSAIESRS